MENIISLIIIMSIIIIALLFMGDSSRERIKKESTANKRQTSTHPRSVIGSSRTDNARWRSETDSLRQEAGDSKPEELFNPKWIEEEEEDWRPFLYAWNEHNLAQGVSFEELRDTAYVLRNPNPEKDDLQTATVTLHKIQGSELFDLLEKSVDGAAKTIALLLDESFHSSELTHLPTRAKSDWKNFDLDQYI